MALATQTERLYTEQQLLGGKRVERRSQVAQDLDANTDCKRNGPECFPELESVVAWCRLHELWKAGAVGAPVEFPRVNYDASNGGTMTANPFLEV